MSHDVPLRCRCGAVRGVAHEVSRDNGTRGICYCDDCQAFAQFLGGSDLLDRAGGTDLYQMMPRRVHFEGGDKLRCVRLSDKGMHRWYVDCCRTPVGNTFGAKVPFVGISAAFFDRNALDAATGAPIARVQGKFAYGELPKDVHKSWPLRLLARGVRLLVTWAVAGGAQPSPYFDPKGQPRAPVRVLAQEERLALA